MTVMKWPTIVYLGNDWSADNRTSSHHIARRLMRDHKVIYVECPGLRAPSGSKRDFKRILAKVAKFFRGPQSLGNGCYVYTLFQVPFHRFTIVRRLNERLVTLLLGRLLRKLGIERPILWFLEPHVAMIMGKLNERLTVYYCIDDYASLPGVNRQMVEEMDHQLTTRADVVFVISAPLQKQKMAIRPNTILSRHGVDYEHFSKVYHHTIEPATEVMGLKSPVIGFFGLVESWIDLDLIKFLAEMRPQWNFLFIGRVAVEQNPCASMPNVHFINSKPYDELPAYAVKFDVCLIPCRNSQLIYNFNPLKLREYLAMGKPVVSTDFPELDGFRDVIEVATSYQEFLQKIETALATDSSEKAQQRMKKVEPFSWENRYRTVTEVVNAALEAKKSNGGLNSIC